MNNDFILLITDEDLHVEIYTEEIRISETTVLTKEQLELILTTMRNYQNPGMNPNG